MSDDDMYLCMLLCIPSQRQCLACRSFRQGGREPANPPPTFLEYFSGAGELSTAMAEAGEVVLHLDSHLDCVTKKELELDGSQCVSVCVRHVARHSPVCVGGRVQLCVSV